MEGLQHNVFLKNDTTKSGQTVQEICITNSLNNKKRGRKKIKSSSNTVYICTSYENFVTWFINRIFFKIKFM